MFYEEYRLFTNSIFKKTERLTNIWCAFLFLLNKTGYAICFIYPHLEAPQLRHVKQPS